MSLQIVNGPTIKAGESLSDGVDCTAGQIVRLTLPANWTPANITFQISSDGGFYNDVYNEDGEEVLVANAPAGSAVVFKPGMSNRFVAFAHVKIRSGTRDNPVKQQQQALFAIALDVPEAPTQSRR
jgi:hypothetical protein